MRVCTTLSRVAPTPLVETFAFGWMGLRCPHRHAVAAPRRAGLLVVGTAMEAPAGLVAAHPHQRLLDRSDRILTFGTHVCNHTTIVI